MQKKIKVLCVDDSALIRSLMTEIINSQPDMEVCATAPDPLVARELIKQHNPDVLTLDVEMPRMDGLDFLEKLMRLRPMPVVMVSSLTERGSEITLRALELGAVDFVTKPRVGIRDGMLDYSEKLADKVRAASRARVRQNPQVFEQLKKWYPLEDFATPDDVANAALFLSSDAARAITGAMLPVDGGLLAGNRVMAQELTLESFY